MVTAIVAGLLFTGAPQARNISYKPTKAQPFAIAAGVSEMLKANEFSADKSKFVWRGKDAEVTVLENEGLINITTSEYTKEEMTQVLQLFDIPMAKCRVKMGLTRPNEEEQTIEARINLGTELKIGGDKGSSALATRIRQNGDGTYTIFCNLTRTFDGAPETMNRSATVVLRVKAGEEIRFGASQVTDYALVEYSELQNHIKAAIEPGVVFKLVVDNVQKP